MPTRADAARAQHAARVLDPEQIAAICDALPEDVRPIVKFAYATGWRTRSEVQPLEWAERRLGSAQCSAGPAQTKNGEARSFPFTADLETILKDQLAIQETLKKAGRVVPFVFHATKQFADFLAM